MKKVLLILIVLVMAAIVAASFAVRQAPEWMRTALEGALGKTVTIQEIDFQFPRTFVLSGVVISEKEGPFAGEPEFSAQTVRLTAIPTALRSGRLALDEIVVRDAEIDVRKSSGRLYHAFSKPTPPPDDVPRGEVSDSFNLLTSPRGTSSGRKTAFTTRPLSVSSLKIENARFRFADFDMGEKGFVWDCEGIEARITGFQVPASSQKTTYQVTGRLLQGRDEKPSSFSFSGSTTLTTLDTDAHGLVQNFHLTYFLPYASRVTAAEIEEGYVDLKTHAVIRSKELSVDAELAFTSLYFRSLEGDNQLFGLSAKEILDFLKDSSGRLRIPLSFRWNFADPQTRLRTVLRKSIEESLKRTVFGNVGALLEAAIVRIGEKGLDAPEKATETVLKKIKDFLKY